MADKFIVTRTDMEDVADEIRAKSGKSDSLTFPNDWKETIKGLRAEEQLKVSEYPSYVHDEVLEIVNKVRVVQTDESIVFIAMSDSHYCADQVVNFYEKETNASTVQANQAAKAIAYMLDIDFFAHLGDVSCGDDSTTPSMLKKQIEGFISYFREAKSDLPVFICIGNHDAGIYYHDAQTDGAVHTLTGEYLYNTFTAHSDSNDTVISGEENGGYCYRDFTDKKLRVFMLNTSEKLVARQIDNTTFGAQRLWLANALLNLNSKADAAEWRFIILSHYPADYGANMSLSLVLEAYVNGASVTITDPANSDYYKGDGTSQTVSFAGKNSAKIVAQFHGHIHNFLYSKLYSNASGSAVQYDARRVCVPNGQYNRENTYGTVNNISFTEDKTYAKTKDTANGTSFVVNVINPSEEKIYSFCYGAGYDRVIGYGAVSYYSVSRTLTNVITNNSNISVEEGKPFSEVIMLNSGCDMKTITVTMGGIDISSAVITIIDGSYQIDIPEVTGNIVITAKAQARPNFTNLVPLSINTDGSDYYVDGDGYDNDVYLSGGTAINFNTSVGYSTTTTGFIPITAGEKIIRIAGDDITVHDEYTRLSFYDSSFNHINTYAAKMLGQSIYYPVIIEEDATALTIHMNNSANGGYNAAYMRICTAGDGANLIVTVDEEITYGGSGSTGTVNYTVVQNLTNVTSRNAQATVAEGSSFSATLTANSGYELGDVVVTMGGLDITSMVYSSGQITISKVTGNIVIVATANAVQASYTNQLPISTDTDGTIYNGVGYKADTYLSSGNVSTRTGSYTSGLIPIKPGDTLYFKNCTINAEQSYHRFARYDSNKVFMTNAQQNTTSSQITGFATPVYGSDGNMKSLTLLTLSSMQNTRYIRFCCSYLGADSIVTVNEPIE